MKQCAKRSKVPTAKLIQLMGEYGDPQPLQQFVSKEQELATETPSTSRECPGKLDRCERDEDFQKPNKSQRQHHKRFNHDRY